MIKKEYLWASLIAFIIVSLSNLYLFMGVTNPKSGLVFLERRVINSQDMYTYVSFIEQARQGRLFFENLYTTEHQTQTLIRPSYTFLGWIAALFGMSSVTAYHVGRILFSIPFFILLYILISNFFSTPKRRLLAFSVTLSATGIGYLTQFLLPQASDLWIPESVTFLSLQEAPHFILSQALMILAFLCVIKLFMNYGVNNGIRSKIFLGILALTLVYLGLEHPYDLCIVTLTVWVASAWLLIKSKSNKIPVNRNYLKIIAWVIMLVTGATAVTFLYQYVETIFNPTLGSWAAISDSPIPMEYIAGFGFLLLFGMIGLEIFLRRLSMKDILIASWVGCGFVLLYAPVFFQRRLSEGLAIPISILSTEGILVTALFLSKFAIKKAKIFVFYTMVCLITLTMIPGTLIGISSDITTINADSRAGYYYYILVGELHGMRWIRDNTSSNDIILTNWFYGNILPGISGRKVFFGHKAQTKQFDEKVAAANKFLLDKNTNEAVSFLKKNRITYIYLGNNDTMLRYGFKPDEKPYLIKVFDEDGSTVYKVR